MNAGKKKTTFGTISIAFFWIVIASGILLAIPFDIFNPYLSISEMMIISPGASIVRNMHFWSSQFFLVSSLIHIYEHFHFKEKIGLKKGVSARLSIGVFIIFMAMLSGFLLKGDADSQQARRILESLILKIPLFGKALSYSFLGSGQDLQLIYIHHIATFTLFIAIIMVEHGRKIWSPAGNFIGALLVVSAVSYLYTAPLHDNINPTVKGPWYFVGFQEILHWLSHPGYALIFFAGILLLIYLVSSAKRKVAFISKRVLLVFTLLYMLLTLTGLFFRGEQWKWMIPGDPGYNYSVLHNFKLSGINFHPDFKIEDAAGSPEIMGRKESCLACHTKTFGFSESHDPNAIGCFSCHGGHPFATNKKQAHRNMITIPGNLYNAKQTCGTEQCHPDIANRLASSLMSNLSGMISVDRTVFGEQEDPDLLTDVHQLGESAADEHLRNLCVHCHLGSLKTAYGPVNEKSRGGGCLACHLNYSKEAENALRLSRQKYVRAHPSVSMNVTNGHCFGCHSRSGRIATNYEGWHETTLHPRQMTDSAIYRLVEGRRVFTKQKEDIHHQLELECIDCHNSYELMGDGKRYAHEEDQQDVQCQDCHFTGDPVITKAEDLDQESAKIASLRYGNIAGREFLTTGKFGRPLINTYVKNDTAFLVTKNGGKNFPLSPLSPACGRDSAHASLSCSTCHTSWAPSCIGCHNTYDNQKEGWDLYTLTKKEGSWIEHEGTFSARLPALGVRTKKDMQEIIPVVPGMILTIDKRSYSGDQNDTTLFRRLYAPSAPHTTSSKGRGCKSCHNNSYALGIGDGQLEFRKTENGKGRWYFMAAGKSEKHDSLPEDAWTGFLQSREGMVSTRKNVSPFDVSLQKKVLSPGACLTCHKESSAIMKESLIRWDDIVDQRSDNCLLPVWE